MGTLLFMIMSLSVLLKMRNVADNSYREENTHFVFNNLFLNILSFF